MDNKTDMSLVFIDDEYEDIDIDDIKIVNEEIELIDINVEDDHTFCITTENIISHNCKSMMRLFVNKCAQTNTTLIFSNHIYDDPSCMFPSLVKNQSGGKGPLYLASLLVQMAVKQEKKKDDKDLEQIISIANRVKGITMRALTVKNRFVPPFLETNLYLNFKTGLYKYAGLLEMALAYNVIQQTGSVYHIGDKKLGFYKNWKDNTDLWEKEIIPVLDKIIQKEFTFSNEALEEIEYNEEQLLTENNENGEDSE